MRKRSTFIIAIGAFSAGVLSVLSVEGQPAFAATLQDVFNQIDQRLKDNAAAIATTNAADGERDKKITQLQADITRLTTDLKSDSDNVDALTARLNKMDAAKGH